MSLLKSSKKTTTVKNMSSTSKENRIIPADSTIIKKDISVRVEEIENGFLVTKTYDIKYKPKGSEHSDYMYFDKKYYSEKNPLEINPENVALADLFD